jgi:hypothetical protein
VITSSNPSGYAAVGEWRVDLVGFSGQPSKSSTAVRSTTVKRGFAST